MMKTLSILTLGVVALATAPVSARAQDGAAAHPVIERAKQLVANGRESDGRRVIDSVLAANDASDAIYAEALYWRGALASTAADAERDYRRLLIEAPMSRRSEDAMLALANLLQARGDRRGASDYLQRFMLTYPSSPARPRVAISLVRLLFDQGPQQQARACEALRMGREAVPASNIELRGQLDFYSPRCTMMMAEAPTADHVPAAPSAQQTGTPVDTAHPAPDPAPAQAPRAFYSVQVAAYDSETSAQQLVHTLLGRGLEARVDGIEKPFRVRIGRYTTRADAVKMLADLKSGGQDGFITLVRPN